MTSEVVISPELFPPRRHSQTRDRPSDFLTSNQDGQVEEELERQPDVSRRPYEEDCRQNILVSPQLFLSASVVCGPGRAQPFAVGWLVRSRSAMANSFAMHVYSYPKRRTVDNLDQSALDRLISASGLFQCHIECGPLLALRLSSRLVPPAASSCTS